MCGRYYIDDEMEKEIEHVVELVDQKHRWEKQGTKDILPMDAAPVIVGSRDKILLTSMCWGYPKSREKGLIINARSETVMEKPLFSRGMEKRRMVIPARGFYEWNRKKEKMTFTGRKGEILYMAGFYDCFGAEDRFVILTTAANQSMIQTHDRMPLLLEKDQIKGWLTDKDRAVRILKQEPAMLRKDAEYEQMTLF